MPFLELCQAQQEVEEWASNEFADYGRERVVGIVRSCYTRTEEHASRKLYRKSDRVEADEIKQRECWIIQNSYHKIILLLIHRTFRILCKSRRNHT